MYFFLTLLHALLDILFYPHRLQHFGQAVLTMLKSGYDICIGYLQQKDKELTFGVFFIRDFLYVRVQDHFSLAHCLSSPVIDVTEQKQCRSSHIFFLSDMTHPQSTFCKEPHAVFTFMASHLQERLQSESNSMN